MCCLPRSHTTRTKTSTAPRKSIDLSKRDSTHVLVLTSRGKGHINPNMTLASRLASLGLSITVVLPDTASYSLVASADLGGLDIALAKLPLQEHEENKEEYSLGWTMEGLRTGITSGYEIPTDYSPQQNALDKLLVALKEGPSPPCCVIVDLLLAWAEKPIQKHGLPRFILYTAAASYFPLVLHIRSLQKQGMLPVSGSFETMEVKGLPTIYKRDVPEAMININHCAHWLHMGWIDHMLTSDGMLFNTFMEFESELFKALKHDYEETKAIAEAILPVGPLFPAEYFGENVQNATKKTSVLKSSLEDQCEAWLDGQPAESVLYVSFGSWALLSPKQIHELALGLEASEQRFLWVLPVQNNSVQELEKILPEGFTKRTSTRGVVLPGWAPQHLILSHPSAGGFLTHCGWNSALEVITLAGIPVIGWPFLADQPPNCRYLVDGVKIGTEVQGDETGFVERKEIERAVRQIMEGPEAEGMRRRAKALKIAARDAVAEGGSSHKNLQAFVSKIKAF